MSQNNTKTLDQKAQERAQIAIDKSLESLGFLDKTFGDAVNNNALLRSFLNLLDMLLDPIAIIISAISSILTYISLIILNVLFSASINTMATILAFVITWMITISLKGLHFLLFK